MRVAPRIEQNDQGRWTWVLFGVNDDWASGKMMFSVVSFSTREQAEQDLALHARAPIDESGRAVRPKEEINQLIRAAAEASPDCEGVKFADVYWHEPDERGSNWSVASMSGENHEACLSCIQSAAITIASAYNIPSEQ